MAHRLQSVTFSPTKTKIKLFGINSTHSVCTEVETLCFAAVFLLRVQDNFATLTTVEAMYYRYWLRNCFPQLEQCRTVLGGSLYPHSNTGVAKEPSQFPDFHSIKNKIFRFLYQLVSRVLLSFQWHANQFMTFMSCVLFFSGFVVHILSPLKWNHKLLNFKYNLDWLSTVSRWKDVIM